MGFMDRDQDKVRPESDAECGACGRVCAVTANGVPTGGSFIEFGVGWAEWDDCLGHLRHGILVCSICVQEIPWLDKVQCNGGES